MGAVGAKVTGPYGQPWRTGKRPYGHSTLKLVASCLKGLYLHVSGLGINEELGKRLDRSRLPTRQDRNRALLGHRQKHLPKNPLTPKQVRRRHPKMAPEGAKQILMEAVNSARDRMVVTWLADGGFRIGELCGLHQADLHLREKAACDRAFQSKYARVDGLRATFSYGPERTNAIDVKPRALAKAGFSLLSFGTEYSEPAVAGEGDSWVLQLAPVPGTATVWSVGRADGPKGTFAPRILRFG